MRRVKHVARAAVVAAMVLSLTSVASAEVTYTIVGLGTLDGDAESVAKAVNKHGQVVGYSYSNVPGGGAHAFLYGNGSIYALGTLPGHTQSVATGINDAGQVVGWSGASDPNYQAFLWSNGVMKGLGTLPGDTCSWAGGINNKGQVVGYSSDFGPSHVYPFCFSGGTMSNLVTPVVYKCTPRAVNDVGEVVGDTQVTNPNGSAFLYKNEVFYDLGTFGYTRSDAHDINLRGQVVGMAYTNKSVNMAFLWQDGIAVDLGTLGGSFAEANAINDIGDVVGRSLTVNGSTHAFLYSNGLMRDLNDLIPSGSGWVVSIAYDINNLGQIVGYGLNPSGEGRGFLLTPTPEPATLSLLALGGLMLLRRRAGVSPA